ncbi:MAG: zf-HC2 domain-containing protein [Gemmatimonadota bacterium]|nr:zf-HC2 domain-containing protein [Gemmatimonadota bacterium]
MPRRSSLSCRQFRRQHAEYLDGYLSAAAVSDCEAHVESCPACARHDVQIRRSLLALQALREIAPSGDFRTRLAARIADDRLASMAARRAPTARWGMAAMILAASVTLMVMASGRVRRTEPVRMIPVLARAPERAAPTPIRPAPTMTAVVAGSGARFEALPGEAPLRTPSMPMRASSIRLQTVSFPGQ